ncbi:nucleoside deaminase [Lichenicoccus roseus]|uniref:Nucleoside deaminase n=1 Tax=Lichenicoccus roseus TaxID=2683649 RepID=A0A5R9J1J9_9PROT|nr:nucleoside deaminase [Lichenicoccus roseus]TLU71525.1 nucleoside deaminase [Lichenicoccus roseus]
MTDDETSIAYMRRALALAEAGQGAPGSSPIGCVIVLDGRIVGEAHNEVGLRHDPTAHAEVVAIRRACESLGQDNLRGATLYSTLQPCGMCSMASIWTSITHIVYGARRQDVHRMYFEDRHLGVMDILHDAFRDDMSATGGVLADECAAYYYKPDDEPPSDEQANV